MQKPYLALLVLCLTGCAATSQPVLNSTPVDITQDQLSAYWVPRESSVSIRAPSTGTGCGVVDIRHLIDSNGDVHDVEVMDAQPKGVFNSAAVEQAEAFQYEPSGNNTQRRPVRVSRHVTFDMNPSDEVDCAEIVKQIQSE